MKNKLWLIIAGIFLVIMVAAVVVYPKLSENYYSENLPEDNTEEDGSEDPDTGTVIRAEDFVVYDSEQNEVRLSDYFGKPIIINFWATWCGPCKYELPAFDDVYAEYREKVTFLMVNLTDGQRDTVSKVKQFVEDNGYNFPVYYDTTYNASNAYGVYSIPETVFINADGTIRDIRVGAINEVILEQYIKLMTEES